MVSTGGGEGGEGLPGGAVVGGCGSFWIEAVVGDPVSSDDALSSDSELSFESGSLSSGGSSGVAPSPFFDPFFPFVPLGCFDFLCVFVAFLVDLVVLLFADLLVSISISVSSTPVIMSPTASTLPSTEPCRLASEGVRVEARRTSDKIATDRIMVLFGV